MSAGAYCSPLGKIAEITDFLYLGGLAAAKTEDMLKEKGITCVINGKLIQMYVFDTKSVPDMCRSFFGCPTIRYLAYTLLFVHVLISFKVKFHFS